MSVINNRNKYTDRILFHIEGWEWKSASLLIYTLTFFTLSPRYGTTNNERIKQGYCLHIWDNLCDIVCRYVTANEGLLTLYIYYIVTKPPWTTEISRL